MPDSFGIVLYIASTTGSVLVRIMTQDMTDHLGVADYLEPCQEAKAVGLQGRSHACFLYAWSVLLQCQGCVIS